MQYLDLLFILESISVLIFLYPLFICLLALKKRKKIKKSHHFPMVTVVVCAWNEEGFIKSCLNSLLNLNYPRYEIIVVCGGKDKTVRICQEYERLGKIRLIHERKRSGKWNSLNKAIRIAKGSTIALMDADSIASENWLSRLIAPLNENIGISCGRFIVKSTKNWLQKIVYVTNGLLNLLLLGFDSIGKIEVVSGSNMAFRKELHDKVKFKPVILEDAFFVMESRSLGYGVRYSPDAVTCYQTVGSIKGLDSQLERLSRGSFEWAKKSVRHSKLIFVTLLLGFLFGLSSIFLIPSITLALAFKAYFLLAPPLILIFLFIILQAIAKIADYRKYPKSNFLFFSLFMIPLLFGGIFLFLIYVLIKEIRKRPVIWLTSEKRLKK
jgi:cellulose synthase/poly-beta-1,6-N-acetylglucosamine synthase-like glycosyltransferase